MSDPRPETHRASAEADRDLGNLKERLEAAKAETEEGIEAALNANDLDKAQELEGVLVKIEETLGLVRYHPYVAANGGSKLIGQQLPFRDGGGRFSQKGSQGHFQGALSRIKKGVRLEYRLDKPSAQK